jgi:hypothetical protein
MTTFLKNSEDLLSEIINGGFKKQGDQRELNFEGSQEIH